MAFIYIQEIENKNLKNNINLLDFKREIKNIIIDFFNIDYKNILKSIDIAEDYFKYSLHLAVNNSILIDINKRVEYFLQEKIKKDIKFKNKKVKYIGFIQEEYIDKEFNTITTLELIEYNSYMNKNFTKETLIDIDTFTLRFKERGVDYFFQTSERADRVEKNKRFLIIEGTIGNNHNYPKLTSFPDSKFIDIFRDTDRKIYGYENAIVRNFNIGEIRFPSEDERENIEKLDREMNKYLDTSIGLVKENSLKDKDYEIGLDNFKVYDVGQGLMVGLFKNNDINYYIDLGIDKNLDILNCNNKIKIKRNKKVILSHIHLDHWHILNLDINAYYQDWYIPKQEKGFIFSKRLGEILSYGKKIYYILEDIEIDSGRVYLGKKFKDLKASHKHENGLYIILEIKEKKILISGDQRYEFMNKQDIGDIDILVASHHGGDYSKFEDRDRTEYLPSPNNLNSLVVYSYGKNNPYNHPNKISDYRKLGWINEYHTVDGNYILE